MTILLAPGVASIFVVKNALTLIHVLAGFENLLALQHNPLDLHLQTQKLFIHNF